MSRCVVRVLWLGVCGEGAKIRRVVWLGLGDRGSTVLFSSLNEQKVVPRSSICGSSGPF